MWSSEARNHCFRENRETRRDFYISCARCKGSPLKDLDDAQIKYISERPRAVSKEKLRQALCHHLGVKWASLKAPQGRQEQQQRAQAIWLCRHHLKMGYEALSREFDVTPSRISKIMKQEGLVSPDLREQISLAVERKAQK